MIDVIFSALKIGVGNIKLLSFDIQINNYSHPKEKVRIPSGNKKTNSSSVNATIKEIEEKLRRLEISIRNNIKEKEKEKDRVIAYFNQKRASRNPDSKIQQGVIIAIFAVIVLLYLGGETNFHENVILSIFVALIALAVSGIALGWSIYIPTKEEIKYKENYNVEMIELKKSLLKVLRAK